MRDNMYSDDYAMRYEYLIRRAHQCGRHGVAGADADIYRRFLTNASIYKTEKEAIENNQPRQWRKSESEMLSDYMVSAGKIAAFIETAIDLVNNEYYNDLNQDQKDRLSQAQGQLLEVNIENITEAIEIAEAVMLEIKLYPK
ncbi:hypothetical protein [Tenacibaculum agarivorans]|uniref:hypothetical protein n=1 Tax=Tenacibaculum agarivorans TaxID=1908389 RepID=UPI00094BA7E4|nr:hypothetical protein [Tenacibaculum agarivorans]